MDKENNKKYFCNIGLIPMLELIPNWDNIQNIYLQHSRKYSEYHRGKYFVWLCFKISWGWYTKY